MLRYRQHVLSFVDGLARLRGKVDHCSWKRRELAERKRGVLVEHQSEGLCHDLAVVLGHWHLLFCYVTEGTGRRRIVRRVGRIIAALDRVVGWTVERVLTS